MTYIFTPAELAVAFETSLDAARGGAYRVLDLGLLKTLMNYGADVGKCVRAVGRKQALWAVPVFELRAKGGWREKPVGHLVV